MKKHIEFRTVPNHYSLGAIDPHPVLDRVYAARGVQSTHDLEKGLRALLPYESLLGIDKAVERLYQVLCKQERVIIIGDFDADGATSTVLAIKLLNAFGATNVSYLVPNRFEYGYGLTPEIVELAAESKPDLLITVDNGITSFGGVDRANALGIDVVVTDHHLGGDHLPNAIAVVNPNQANDPFPSKNLAGCGVIFYVMLALRAYLRKQQWFDTRSEPNMAAFLDIVALGTVADVVPLDKNNRILVHQGLKRIRSGHCALGIKSLLEMSKRRLATVSATDLAFAVAPRLNAAGRLEDMSIGIECLFSTNPVEATQLAFQLDEINKERRKIEDTMKEEAFATLKRLDLKEDALKQCICLYDKRWHQGVVGILAARIKDKYHRPTVIFAKGDKNTLKASGRSVSGFHLKDCFERIAAKHLGLLTKFGGHAMAAGLSLREEDFETFLKALNEDVDEHLNPESLRNNIVCDGELLPEEINLKLAEVLKQGGPWGQAFPEPMFVNRFRLVDQRIVGAKHLKLHLAIGNQFVDGILFFADLEHWPNHRCQFVKAVYRLDVNEFRNQRNVQLMVDYLEPL